MDAILALRLLSELHQEFNQPLSVAYVNLKAAFDSVDRSALWATLHDIGVPDRLLGLIKDLHAATTAKVRQGRDVSELFQTQSGVRQGCILAPSLFCRAMDWTLERAVADSGITIGLHKFSDLDYADDVVLFSHKSEDLTNSLESIQSEASNLGLNISWKKTKIQIQKPNQNNPSSHILVSGQSVDVVEDFIYLGSKISNTGRSGPDILRRLGLASSAMSSLRRVWRLKKLKLTTKLCIYRTCVIPVLLYGSETWTLLKCDFGRLEAFHLRCQRSILGIRWFDFISNNEIIATTQLPSIASLILRRQRALFSHIARLDDNTPAKKALNIAINAWKGRPPATGWTRPRGRPRSPWIAQLGRPSEVEAIWNQAVQHGHRRSARRTNAVFAAD